MFLIGHRNVFQIFNEILLEFTKAVVLYIVAAIVKSPMHVILGRKQNKSDFIYKVLKDSQWHSKVINLVQLSILL